MEATLAAAQAARSAAIAGAAVATTTAGALFQGPTPGGAAGIIEEGVALPT